MTTVVLVDDHCLLRNGLATVINTFTGYRVLFEASNGKEFTELLDPSNLPHIVLLDVTMPQMNGYETAYWITTNYPAIKILALSMLDDERSIIKMLRNGARGYILKDAELNELKRALDSVVSKGIYINEVLCNNIIYSMNGNLMMEESEQQKLVDLTEREKEFLRWLCTDKSYKEIASNMFLSPRTIDGYRDILFEKLKVASRVGLVIFAIRHEIVKL